MNKSSDTSRQPLSLTLDGPHIREPTIEHAASERRPSLDSEATVSGDTLVSQTVSMQKHTTSGSGVSEASTISPALPTHIQHEASANVTAKFIYQLFGVLPGDRIITQDSSLQKSNELQIKLHQV